MRHWCRRRHRNGGHHAALADLPREDEHRVVGWNIERLRHEPFVDAGLAQGAGAVAGGEEGLHELHGAARVEGVERRDAAIPAHGGRRVAAGVRGPGEFLQRHAERLIERASLLFHPVFELGDRREPEAVQEGTGHEAHGALVVLPANQILELGDVAPDFIGVEAQLAGAEEDVGGVGVATKGVERLLQGVPTLLVVGVGPEGGLEPVARNAARAGAGDHGQQGLTPRLGGRPLHARVGTVQGQSAERGYAQHAPAAPAAITAFDRACWGTSRGGDNGPMRGIGAIIGRPGTRRK